MEAREGDEGVEDGGMLLRERARYRAEVELVLLERARQSLDETPFVLLEGSIAYVKLEGLRGREAAPVEVSQDSCGGVN